MSDQTNGIVPESNFPLDGNEQPGHADNDAIEAAFILVEEGDASDGLSDEDQQTGFAPAEALKKAGIFAGRAVGAARDAAGKGAKVVGDAAAEAAKVAPPAAQDLAQKMQAGAVDLAEKAKLAADDMGDKARLAFYNPVFREETFGQQDYTPPKMIVIADAAERAEINVCKDAIGWSDSAGDMDVLYLYKQEAPSTDLVFFPQMLEDAVYYIDPSSPKRYISLDSYFETIKKDKYTELQEIAYSLGAKKCTLVSEEDTKSLRRAKGKLGVSVKGAGAKASAEAEREARSHSAQRVEFVQEFEGCAEPQRPNLRWFVHDRQIEHLINTRCGGEDMNKSKRYSMVLDESVSQSMSTQAAAKVEKALKKIGVAGNFSFEGEALNESRRRLVFEIEF